MGCGTVCTALNLEMTWFLGLVSHQRNLINLSPGVLALLHKGQFSLKLYLLKGRSSRYKIIKVKCVLMITALLQHMSRNATKPTKWVCTQRRLRSAWASAQSDQSSLSAWRKLGSLATHWVQQRRLWSDWADAQADLSLRCAHTHFVGFVMSRLIYAWQ